MKNVSPARAAEIRNGIHNDPRRPQLPAPWILAVSGAPEAPGCTCEPGREFHMNRCEYANGVRAAWFTANKAARAAQDAFDAAAWLAAVPPPPPPPSLDAYAAMLAGHDWHFGRADDHGAWRAGSSRRDDIVAIAAATPQHRALYDAWARYVFSDGPRPTTDAQ